MPNRLILAGLICVLPQIAAAAVVGPHGQENPATEVLAVCDSPEGLDAYFRGGIVSGEGVAPANATDASESLTLVRQGGQYDLLFRDGAVVRSARASGGTIEASELENGSIRHLIVSQDGYMDHFVFQTTGNGAGKVVWATQRVARDNSGSLQSAPCRRF